MIEAAKLDTAPDGTPRSARYDDVYHSSEGGLAQARHVFLAGNQLPQRWLGRTSFTILETGFGLGLNFLATWQAWRADPLRPARLNFVSTELHPFRREDLRTLQAQWPELAPLATELQDNWPPLTPGMHHLLLDQGRVTLTLLFGDALHTLPELTGNADAIYLDGFAPQKNPQLWSSALLAAVTAHAAPGATLATWCVAGEVRRHLDMLGWKIGKKVGFGGKRHMLAGTHAGGSAPAAAAPRTVMIIGAGIAGCSSAEALARRGWTVTLIDRESGPAQAASGNPIGILHPLLALDDNAAARISRAGFLYTRRLLRRLAAAGHAIDAEYSGLLELEADDEQRNALCHRHGFPPDYAQSLSQDEASTLLGQPVASGALWYPQGVTLHPASLCQALLASAGPIDCRWRCEVAQIVRHADSWQAIDASGRIIAQAAHVVFANAAEAARLLPALHLPLTRIRGQISYIPARALPPISASVCGKGYLTRPLNGMGILGASFIKDDESVEERASEHEANQARLGAMLPGAGPLPVTGARVGFRTASQDRLPLIGQLPQTRFRPTCTLNSLPREEGLFALLALGSRSLCWGPLGGELLAARMQGDPLPLEKDLQRFIDPARFHLNHLRQQ